MSRISRNLSIILRSERLIAQRRMAVLRRQTGLMAAAGIAAAVGLVMLNFAAYFALVEHLSAPLSALIIALANMVIAALLMSAANKQNADAEVSGVAEVRDMAMEDLEGEVQEATEEVKALAGSVRKMASDPLGALAPGLLGTVASAVVKNLKK